MSGLANTISVARREYTVRVRTRSFVLGTALLVFSVIAVAMLPVIVRYLDQTGTQAIGVWVGADDVTTDPAAALEALLNAPTADETAEPDGERALQGHQDARPRRRSEGRGGRGARRGARDRTGG